MNRFVGECEAYYVGERERSDLLALHLLLLYILILFLFCLGDLVGSCTRLIWESGRKVKVR